jgi:hypothetical protein
MPELHELPGVGQLELQMLKEQEIFNCYQMLGIYLTMWQSPEHTQTTCDRFYTALREIGFPEATAREVVKAVALRVAATGILNLSE